MNLIESSLNWLFRHFTQTKFWRWFARDIMGPLHFDIMGFPDFNFNELETIQSRLIPFDQDNYYIYFGSCTHRKSFASIMIRWITSFGSGSSRYTHSFLVLNKNYICEMVGKGFQTGRIENLLAHQDDITIARVRLSKEQYDQVWLSINSMVAEPSRWQYDFAEEMGNGQYVLYCAELPYILLKPYHSFKTTRLLGREIITPDDLVNSGNLIYQYPKQSLR